MLLAEKLAESPTLAGEAFNFSNEIQVTVLDLVRRVLTAMGSSLEPEVLNQASNEIPHQWLSAEKARTWLGWSPLYDLEDGLASTIRWYRRYLEA
jgi:CDP-glucose 4,6-dehydratase